MFDFLAALLAGGALVAIGYFVIMPALRSLVAAQARREDAAEIDSEWFTILHDRVPASRGLSEPERVRLLKLARALVATRRWEGAGGLVLSIEMKVVIASQASILTLTTRSEPYPGLREILVYPAGFIAKRARDPRKWLETSDPEEPTPELGEAWGNGVIVLGWEGSLEGANDPTDGSNLVIHEFAHQFAHDHHLIPPSIGEASITMRTAGFGVTTEILPVVPDVDRWRRVLAASYARRCERADGRSVLSDYATTNLAEFFAVATESFFERPAALEQEDGALYEQLVMLYGRDPKVGAST
ncbi:MAG: M90 family metallopeptidase [Gemmatimonadaceae bacterium]